MEPAKDIRKNEKRIKSTERKIKTRRSIIKNDDSVTDDVTEYKQSASYSKVCILTESYRGIDTMFGKSTEYESDTGKGHKKNSDAHVIRKLEKGIKMTRQSIRKITSRKSEAESEYGEEEISEVIEDVKKTSKVFAMVTVFVKSIFSLAMSIVKVFTNIIAVITIVCLVSGLLIYVSVQNVTYDFIVDEAANYKQIIIEINDEFSASVKQKKQEYGCDKIKVYGQTATWKDMIAFYHAFKSQMSDTSRWQTYFTSDEYQNLLTVFKDFNEITYSVNEGDEGKELFVVIKPNSLQVMYTKYGFSAEQVSYCKQLLSDDEVWEDILDTDYLSMYALNSLNQSRDTYASWYPLYEDDGWDTAFIYYGLASMPGCSMLEKRKTAEYMKEDMEHYGYYHSSHFEDIEIGDIVFLNVSGTLKSGIVVETADDIITFVAGDYMSDIVISQAISISSSILTGYAHINLFSTSYALNGYEIGSYGILGWPVDGYGVVTSRYGIRETPGDEGNTSFHHGLDIACTEGTPIVACMAGTVIYAGYEDNPGNYVIIQHDDGLKTVYMHNSELLVEIGTEVERGQLIAYSGNTGWSTGPHCHIAVMLNGAYVDPELYLVQP